MATAAQSARAAAREMRSRAIPGTVEAPPLRVVWSLARVEAWKMLRHPAYLVGLGFAMLLFGGLRGSRFSIEPLLVGVGAALVIGTLFAADLGALRSRRDGTDELFGSAPAPLAARTAAVLVAVVLGPVVAVCLWALAFAALERTGAVDLSDDFRYAQLVQAPLVVAAVGALGVATARLIPHVIGGPIVLAIHVFTPLVWALPWVRFETEPSTYLWHLTYLVSATIVFASAAFLRDRVRPLPALTFVGGLAVAILSAYQRGPDGAW